MGEYFESAGFEILDSKTYQPDENKFANAWGHCDEDGYRKVINQADISFNKNKNFFTYFLTTSNHRPYTYPLGTIKTGTGDNYHRAKAVRYADYALGKFLEEIKKKPWYKDTIIVYVADHCAGSGGRFEINVENYRIPLVFYGHNIKPQVVKKICNQIDILPTLMGMLNFEYKNVFFGKDIFDKNFKERARELSRKLAKSAR
jgi:phosphoglycerol transferase MdoB-like AlkP superfamily enzyme